MSRRRLSTFQGVLFDILEEVVIDRAPVLRGSYAEAMEDAKQMVAVVNVMAENADDETPGNTTIGRVDESYAEADRLGCRLPSGDDPEGYGITLALRNQEG